MGCYRFELQKPISDDICTYQHNRRQISCTQENWFSHNSWTTFHGTHSEDAYKVITATVRSSPFSALNNIAVWLSLNSHTEKACATLKPVFELRKKDSTTWESQAAYHAALLLSQTKIATGASTRISRRDSSVMPETSIMMMAVYRVNQLGTSATIRMAV